MAIDSNNRILIIDDNEAIHADFKKALIKNPVNAEMQKLEESLTGIKTESIELPLFEIDSAFLGEEGLECVQRRLNEGRPYALAFVDIRMPPGWDGIETIEKIWEVDKNIQTVVCTAHSDYSFEDIYQRLGHSDRLLILKKPFDIVEIRLATLALTKKWALNKQANLKLTELNGIVSEKTQALSLNLSLTEATLESTADGIMVVDRNKKIVRYNQKFCEMWNIPCEVFEPAQELAEAQDIVARISQQLDQPFNLPIDIDKMIKDRNFGTYRELELKTGQFIEQYVQPQYHKNDIIGIVYSFRDITQRKRMEEELAKQATYDQLTGLPNRLLLVDRIQHGISYAKRHNTQLAVLFMGLDSFKLVNDSLGHDVGDELLKTFAKRLKNCLNDSDCIRLGNSVNADTVARIGGDEFIVILSTNDNKSEHILPVIQRLYNALTKPYSLSIRELTMNISIGISIYPEDGQDPITLIKHADSAMHSAKEKGKGSFEFYSKEMTEKSTSLLELENDLRLALSRNELFLNYQPLFSVSEKRIASMEVLMRWQHPKLGLVEPATFIPIAESSGLIIPLTIWLLRTACAQNKVWQESGLPPIPIAVNISGTHFKQENIVDEIKDILSDTGLDPKYLELELTENILMYDNHDVNMKIQKLKEIGISIDIDDFGTGYSSLSYINQFAIDKIKIDQSFIRKLSNSVESQVIVQAILMIAKSLKLCVVAEGVETDAQLEILKNTSTDIIQGNYLSHPLSVEDATQILKSQWEWPSLTTMEIPNVKQGPWRQY